MIGSAVRDALAVEGEPQPQHAVGRRVLRADVEDHVLGGQLFRPDADPDHAFRHMAMLPPAVVVIQHRTGSRNVMPAHPAYRTGEEYGERGEMYRAKNWF